eukprot:m.484359 g.484359  ORF g.484359 m.484359 type:complete len:189 (+) comp23327_c0_seq1:81-647(+)
MVKSWAQTLCLKDDPAGIEKYKQLHANSWPEILQALKTVGILSMKIYLKETRMFMYMETVDEFEPSVDFPKHMELTDKAVEWGKVCSALQVKAPEASEGDWWTFMEEVYDFQQQYRKFVGDDGPVDQGVSVESYYDRMPMASPGGVIQPGKVTLTKPAGGQGTQKFLTLAVVAVIAATAGYAVGSSRR